LILLEKLDDLIFNGLGVVDMFVEKVFENKL
jgi:hypothetical protein